MKRDIRVLIIDTCGWITTIGIVIFFFTLWLYSYNNIQEPLKESWSIAFNSLSALATIGAAIVAARLFNDWKEQHNKQVQNNLSLQVFEAFSIFERNLREFSLYISHFEALRSSYENYELTWDIINKDGHIVYLQNINSKKDEMDLNFYSFLDKLRSYYIFCNNLKQFNVSHRRYFDEFIKINKVTLPIITPIDHLVDYDNKYIGYTDLKNIINSLEIQKIIINLNA